MLPVDFLTYDSPTRWAAVLASHVFCQLDPSARGALWSRLHANLASDGFVVVDKHFGLTAEPQASATEHVVAEFGSVTVRRDLITWPGAHDDLNFRETFSWRHEGLILRQDTREGVAFVCSVDEGMREALDHGFRVDWQDEKWAKLTRVECG